MSYKAAKAGNKYDPGYREFCISSPSDVTSLPTSTPNSNGEIASAGSTAYTQDMEHLYLLGTDDVWREV